MSYFAPYLDASGIHMPTYADRLEALVSAYRSIFGMEAELSASVPDYQLLSVFARALDDASALVLQAYWSRNPQYAHGQALDLLSAQVGLTRQAGETDTALRNRIASAAQARGLCAADAIRGAVSSLSGFDRMNIRINEGDGPDDAGIPGHSVAVVVRGGNTDQVARAIFRAKAPGIGTYGSTTRTVVDDFGESHSISFSRPVQGNVAVRLVIRGLSGFDEAAVKAVLTPAIVGYISGRPIGGSLIVPELYGVCYGAAGSLAPTFCITDIQCSKSGTTTREVVQADWNQILSCMTSGVQYVIE